MAEDLSKIDKTLSRELIDEDYIVRLVRDAWTYGNDQRSSYLERKQDYEASWRDLTNSEMSGPWENSANFKPPHILTFGKAVHARLWQLFSTPSGFFSVKARREVFQEKEGKISEFMNFILNDYCNGKQGVRREIDKWLWDLVFQGSGYLKVYWKREEIDYTEVQTVAEIEEELVFSPMSPTGQTQFKSTAKEKEVDRTEILETPQIRRICPENVMLPPGEMDPQESSYVVTNVCMSDETLKAKVRNGIFYKDAVEEAIKSKDSIYTEGDTVSSIKEQRQDIDGVNADWMSNAYMDGEHIVYEWYGKAYITKEFLGDETQQDLSEFPKEIVAWIHRGTGKVLGWTYLHRVSPGGIRPIFKSDYVTFPDRSEGVGVAELLYENQRQIMAVTNLRIDNGVLASTPMFAYRSASGLKPGNWRIKPGQGVPVDDINDIRMLQFPFLTSFGYQEEQSVYSLSERLIALSDLNLGIAPQKVGALRNATGSNLLASESNIQLEIHYDRISTCWTKVLQFLFRLCRERIPSELYYRVTSDTGSPIFGKVDRESLKGEYDFMIAVDILGQTALEKQQMAILSMNTLMNPAFIQTGIVQPENLYNLGKNFLRAHKASRIDDLITKPQGYTGEKLNAGERIFRIVVGAFDGIENTIRLEENHEEALAILDKFEKSAEFGLLTQPEQLTAFQALMRKHQELMMAANPPGMPNSIGQQIPREGMGPIGPGGQGSEALLQDVGIANGPVV